ncbi:MAG: hypothetical protein U0176_17290 [Bacteroidia bacterium]
MNHRTSPDRTLLSFVAATAITLNLASCNCGNCTDKEALRKQITETEKAFEKMAADSGVAEAFYYYAAENAVIKRQNDTLIHGREGIKNFYSKPGKRAVTWNPDFVDVSDDGTMAYHLWRLPVGHHPRQRRPHRIQGHLPHRLATPTGRQVEVRLGLISPEITHLSREFYHSPKKPHRKARPHLPPNRQAKQVRSSKIGQHPKFCNSDNPVNSAPMRTLASIQRIKSLAPIPGADAIEKATVLGWQLVVKKGEFQVGDLAVYCEIDSLLPDRPEFEFLKPRGMRIKTIRLRGEISQGICFPLSILPEGTAIAEGADVTEILEVTKCRPPSPPPSPA